MAWENLASVPDGHLGEVVQLRIQADSRPRTWEPFLTRFSPEDYVCLRACPWWWWASRKGRPTPAAARLTSRS